MIKTGNLIAIIAIVLFMSCSNTSELQVTVLETSADGNKLTAITEFESGEDQVVITLKPKERYQEIIGIGGSFTESSAYLLNELSEENREMILQAYFGDDGARYSLCRTHINSCDFSLSNYAYVTDSDTALSSFSIEEDINDIIPMINDAKRISKDGFKIISSPWTAPPWMKDNNSWVGGKLLPEYYNTWALFFSKYINAYNNEGIDIWGVTVENEPLGNGNNWESMHFTPEEMRDFVNEHLGPQLENDGHETFILGYDQNRGEELEEWAKVIYKDESSSRYFNGFAVHWYASTYDYFGESLQFTHSLAPDKMLIQTEGCVDAEVPKWKDDKWYWSKEATDWGWDWASEEQKYLHPKYVPVYRYARDIIGCLNNQVQGWVDWNMVLNKQGGPNWFKNWCVAPVIVDEENDEVYFTPLYDVMVHFSKYIRPGAVRIGFDNPDEKLMVTAAQNPDNSIVVVALNMEKEQLNLEINLNNKATSISIGGQAIQTIVIESDNIE